jgi:tRNA threonylcarbamoyladenosine biosynthesis protein TsaE
MLTFHATSLADTQRLAAALAAELPDGSVVVLSGTLGAGKTQFVRSFAAAKAIDETDVTSPTYVLCQHYSGECEISHLDVYRLNSQEEFAELGVEEIIDASDVTFVEWGEQVSAQLPEERICVQLNVEGENERVITVTAQGTVLEQAIARVNSRLTA